MITGKPQKNLQSAKQYFHQHLAQGDYHSEGQRIPGLWFGKGVVRLGLNPDTSVTSEQFERLCDNLHPVTGEKLTVRRRVVDHRIYYDFSVGAPKSVSIVGLTVGDPRILVAHDEAALEAMAEMEKVAAGRVRQDGQRSERTTGEIVAAVFRHDASRALDPLLHSHFVMFNATWDPVEHRWKALETKAMFEHINYFTEVYRNRLAMRLREFGYRLRETQNGFEIEGVSQAIIDRFSKRRQAILAAETDAVAAVNKKRLGVLEQNVRDLAGERAEILEKAERALREFKPVAQLTNTGRATLAHTTRPWKDLNLNPAEVLAYQRSQLSAEELENLQRLTQSGPRVSQSNSETVTAAQAIDYARDHLFERNSVVPGRELLREALVFSRGRLALVKLQTELKNREEFLAIDEFLTTRETLLQEREMIALVNRGIERFAPLNAGYPIRSELTDEQRQAVRFILNSTDQVIGLRGGAGTGKTHLLKELVRGIEQRQGTVILAPSTAAVEVLRHEGFKGTATTQRFLQDEAFQQEAKDSVIIIDEAGLLSRRDMLSFLEIARRLNSRIILSGDTRQHSGVEAGDALRLLEERSALRVARVNRIQRQVSLEYRTAINELANGEGSNALARLERLGAVQEVEQDNRYRVLAREYVASLRAGKRALVVSPTWREIEQATANIREQLKAEGMLAKEERALVVIQGLKWTKAQKRDLRNYRSGLVLNFHRSTTHFAKGDTAEVIKVDADALQVRVGDGREVQLSKKQANCFEVSEKQELPVAVGERLLLQGSLKSSKLFNGQVVAVRGFGPQGTIALTDGRTIPAGFKTFTHGYCVTSHASQGRTVDHVFVAIDSHSSQAANRNQFYVSASRGREQVKIFTDDKEFLWEIVNKSGARLSAIELTERAQVALRQAADNRQAASPRLKVG